MGDVLSVPGNVEDVPSVAGAGYVGDVSQLVGGVTLLVGDDPVLVGGVPIY